MKEKAVFAAGCFWGIEKAFSEVKGVVTTMVGYTGGHTKNSTYENVCSGRTGHAEAVLVEFDPKKVSYEKLLQVFWSTHDPTSYHRQGPDIGSQYRSAIYYHSAQQRKLAEKSRDEMQKRMKKKIVTEIVPAKEFYKAEEYHQKYYEKHPLVCAIGGLLK